ncbi:MAG: type II toxin-antitoxin system death-on-curing family toxin [Candidatus Dormibacteraeota bacterium]|nr:type II toxin-antitoxin system death-on-curing family toxin [Candidatus Dormibacteraeota bacterium]
MTVRYLDLTDFLAIAAEVTNLDAETLTRVTNLNLAESALHAPAASWAGEDFYPEFVDKAAVLLAHLAKNHPLPDGNKRAAWVALRLFLDMNGWAWDDYPSVDDAEGAMVAVAAGEWNAGRLASWLAPRLLSGANRPR